MVTFEVASQMRKKISWQIITEYILISVLNIKLQLAVGTRHNRYILAFNISKTDYYVKSFSVKSSVMKSRIIF